MWSHLYIFAVVAIAFGVKPKNSLQRRKITSLSSRGFNCLKSYVQMFNPFLVDFFVW